MIGCMTTSTLDKVRKRLGKLKGSGLDAVAQATGISYDTLLRIRDGKTDPAYGKVEQLRLYFSAVSATMRRVCK